MFATTQALKGLQPSYLDRCKLYRIPLPPHLVMLDLSLWAGESTRNLGSTQATASWSEMYSTVDWILGIRLEVVEALHRTGCSSNPGMDILHGRQLLWWQ